jgi:hypothetical protein
MTNETANEIASDTDSADSSEIAAPEPMRILKIATCPSLSGRSELTYHVGCNESGAIHFRLWANTAAGMFNNMWVPMADLSNLLSVGNSISSTSLLPFFENTSRNNAGFILAVLKGEGLVEPAISKDRSYQCCDPKPFLDRINALVASGVDLPVDDPAIDVLQEVVVPIVAKRGRPKKA